MEKKTKKMVATESEISQMRKDAAELSQKIKALDDYKPLMQNGVDAKTQAVNELFGKRDTINADINKLSEQLEVQTVLMLAGLDTEMAEPTPAGSLREAS